jgi:hypothetical protein
MAYHISVVEPFVFVACDARCQVALVCVMELTLPEDVPRVAIMAMRVLPAEGAEESDTLNEVAALPPVEPVADCTRAGVPPAEIVREPTSALDNKPFPLRVTASPETKLEMLSDEPSIELVRSYTRVPVS